MTFPLRVDMTWKAGAGRHPALSLPMINRPLSGYDRDIIASEAKAKDQKMSAAIEYGIEIGTPGRGSRVAIHSQLASLDFASIERQEGIQCKAKAQSWS